MFVLSFTLGFPISRENRPQHQQMIEFWKKCTELILRVFQTLPNFQEIRKEVRIISSFFSSSLSLSLWQIMISHTFILLYDIVYRHVQVIFFFHRMVEALGTEIFPYLGPVITLLLQHTDTMTGLSDFVSLLSQISDSFQVSELFTEYEYIDFLIRILSCTSPRILLCVQRRISSSFDSFNHHKNMKTSQRMPRPYFDGLTFHKQKKNSFWKEILNTSVSHSVTNTNVFLLWQI